MAIIQHAASGRRRQAVRRPWLAIRWLWGTAITVRGSPSWIAMFEGNSRKDFPVDEHLRISDQLARADRRSTARPKRRGRGWRYCVETLDAIYDEIPVIAENSTSMARTAITKLRILKGFNSLKAEVAQYYKVCASYLSACPASSWPPPA